VNSVTGEDDRLEAILPLVRRYGAAVIALANDETGIPETADQRLAITAKILEVATAEYGIPAEDIVLDPLAMTVGADTDAVNVTLETIARIKATHGINMTMGASNVSFGLPDRQALNAAFLPMAVAAGLTSAIMDARSPTVVKAVKAADLLLGRDPWGTSWIRAYRSQQQ
jgi:5-methyltetrahydrofolate--homocysteine methyltransferase